MLKIHYNKQPFYNQILYLENKLFSKTLNSIYKIDPDIKFIIITDDDQFIGFMSYKDRDISYDIFKIAIDPKFQHYGYGSLLMNNLNDKDIILEVNSTNEKAINFYLKHDFKIIDTLENYYDGVDGYKMYKKKSLF